MGKKVVIVHHWQGSPQDDWCPWAKKELERMGFEVLIPDMPESYNPRISTWVPYLATSIGEVDEETVLIGHGVGFQTILRFLEGLASGKRVDKVIGVAGWFKLSPAGMATPDERQIATPWIENPIDFEKVKSHTNSIIDILSKDDPRVPFEENKKIIEEKLGAKVIEETRKGHFDDGFEVHELPELLQLV